MSKFYQIPLRLTTLTLLILSLPLAHAKPDKQGLPTQAELDQGVIDYVEGELKKFYDQKFKGEVFIPQDLEIYLSPLSQNEGQGKIKAGSPRDLRANVNMPLDREGNTLLHLLAGMPNKVMSIEYLASQGADPFQKNHQGKMAWESAFDVASLQAVMKNVSVAKRQEEFIKMANSNEAYLLDKLSHSPQFAQEILSWCNESDHACKPHYQLQAKLLEKILLETKLDPNRTHTLENFIAWKNFFANTWSETAFGTACIHVARGVSSFFQHQKVRLKKMADPQTYQSIISFLSQMMEKHGCQKELSKINLEEFLYGEHVGKEEFLTDCPKFTLEDVLSEFQRGSFNPEKILIILEKNLLANQETPGTLDILLQIASQKGELALVKKLMEKV